MSITTMNILGKLLVLIVLLNSCEKESYEPTETLPLGDASETVSCVYTQKVSGQFEICKTENDSHTTLTDANGLDKWWPKHSTSRGEILFYQSESSREINDFESASLCKLNANNETITLIPEGSFGWDKQGLCNWAHSGNEIVMAAVDSTLGTWQVYITDANGGNPKRITTRDDVDYFDPIFSLNDKKIYCSSIPENEELLNSNIEIMRIDVNSGEEERLTYNNYRDHHPDISPDENFLIYESLIDPDYLSIGKWAIKELNLATSAERIVIEDDNINLFPKYSATQNLIYLTELEIETFQMRATVYNTSTKEKFPVNETEDITMNPDPF